MKIKNVPEMDNIVCFTGYRPQKCPWGFNELDTRFLDTKCHTKKVIEQLIVNGSKYFITGMALGFDIMCAELILEFKEIYKDITLECAIPCKNQEKFWKENEKIRYKKILDSADIINIISNWYTDSCMFERNKYMVNKSKTIVALFDGKSGGTKHTIDYAKSLNKRIIMISPCK